MWQLLSWPMVYHGYGGVTVCADYDIALVANL